METKKTSLLEQLGMRRANAEGPLCLWSPENNRLIAGYSRLKKRRRTKETE